VARLGGVAIQGGHQFGEGPTTAARHEAIPQVLPRGVERDSQLDLGKLGKKGLDGRRDAASRQREEPRGDLKPLLVKESLEGGAHRVHGQKRLSHSHEDDVPQGFPFGSEGLDGPGGLF